MAFVRIPGLRGKLYVPAQEPENPKKYNCPDCYSCQMCSDDRCRLCGQKPPGTTKKTACSCAPTRPEPLPDSEDEDS